jgi:hypothetical protein
VLIVPSTVNANRLDCMGIVAPQSSC